MKAFQVFDPALCCSTGVCGVNVDQALVSFAADVDWAKRVVPRSSVSTLPGNLWRLPTIAP